MVNISVIVPVYNVESVLKKCIDSILNQTYKSFELLLIDDGSTDGSGAICDEYTSSFANVRTFHVKNSGVSTARNIGIQNAKGKWITFVDSDDFVDLDFLSNFQLDNVEADFYLQGYKKILNETISSIYTFKDRQGLVDAYDAFVESEKHSIMNSPVSKLFNVTIIKDNSIKFDIKTSYGEDHLFVLLYMQYVGKCYLSTSVSYNYVLHQMASLTRRIVPLNELQYYTIQCFELQNKFLDSCPRYKLDNPIAIVNYRTYINIMRMVRDFFKSEKHSRRIFENTFSFYRQLKHSYFGLKSYQKFFLFCLKYLPLKVSYIFCCYVNKLI